MGKYYKLFLNGSRPSSRTDSDHCDYGLLSFMPRISHEKTLFGKTREIKEYIMPAPVIAKKVDNHFEEIIFDKKIVYDKNGIIYCDEKGRGRRNNNGLFRDHQEFTNEEILEEINKGLTCHYYIEASNIEVASFIKEIKNNQVMIQKYYNELVKMENKENLKTILLDRYEEETINDWNERKAMEIIDAFEKAKKR